MLAVRILALRHSLPGNRTVPTSGPQRARPPPPAPSRTHFGTPLWLPPIPPTRSLQVSPALVRSFSSTARNRFENRVAEKQKLFQVGGAGRGEGKTRAEAGEAGEAGAVYIAADARFSSDDPNCRRTMTSRCT